MNICVRAAIAATLFPVCAVAQTVTIETTLRDRGFTEGIVLQGRTTSSVFVALPRSARASNGKIFIDGQSTTPTLQRGSFSVDVNGQLVEAVSLIGKSGVSPLQRAIALRDDRLSGFDALNIRFETDLRATTDPCTDDIDPANSITISPSTRIAFDVDIGQVRSISDAVTLLPRRPLVQLPAQATFSAQVATAALQLGVLLTMRGQEPRFETARGDDPVVVRLDSVRDRAPDSPSIRIERKGNKLDIVVDPASDLIALGHLLQAAPGVLIGEQAVISRAPNRSQSVDDEFRAFSAVPPSQRIKQFGDWRINFPLVASNARLAESALLKLFIAPDWSGENPILTVYLNDQIVAAARPSPGQRDISVPLPATLLRFSNTLRVTLERAGGQRYCAATDLGQSAQILPGSGLVLGKDRGVGFIRAATAFASEVQVGFPQGAADSSRIGAYLQLTSKILASFGPHTGKVSAVFGSPSSSIIGGIIRFEFVSSGGLILSIADHVEGRDLRYDTASPLGALSAEDDGRTLLVQLTDAQNLPQPRSLYLGSGSRALIADSGVVWQNNAPGIGPSVVRQVLALGEGISSKTGIAVTLIAMALLGLLLSSRAIIKAVYDRLRRVAEK